MKFSHLEIPDLILVEPDVFADARGFFLESYNKKVFAENGINVDFVQDNHSRSSKNILRGLHYQVPPFAQDKLVRVTQGEVLDVAVDIRKNSPTFGKWTSIVLSGENKNILFIPIGFAHGFAVLSEQADFEYKVSNYYSKEHDRGILWNDPELNIDWRLESPLLSAKDAANPLLSVVTDFL